MTGRTRKVLIGVAAAALAGGAFAVSTGMSSAGESCAGLDTALQNNLTFIAGQKANPDALSDARIANRQAVVDLINQRRATAGCTGDVQAQPPAQAPAQPRPRMKARPSPRPRIKARPNRRRRAAGTSSARARPSRSPARAAPRPRPAARSRSAPPSR
ncbi:hypothetical protein Asp14428_48230 [Actinoplanes sp. NBRC 14428]|nr:hypothetical protein Asp14428_48230 [Actinoplanes sp. NBRC 14428]